MDLRLLLHKRSRPQIAFMYGQKKVFAKDGKMVVNYGFPMTILVWHIKQSVKR